MSAPSWCARYIGIPYKEGGRMLISCGPHITQVGGLDCWGLVRFVLLREFGVEVKELEDMTWADHSNDRSLAEAVEREAAQWAEVWRMRSGDAVPQELTRPGDVLLIRLSGYPVHVGVVAQAPWFIHTEEAHDSALADMGELRHVRRIIGVYRHERLNEGSA